MKYDKNKIILVVAYLLVKIHVFFSVDISGDILEAQTDSVFNVNLRMKFLEFALEFFCLLFLCGDYKKYIENIGKYLILRTHKRSSIISKFVLKIAITVATINIINIMLYSACALLEKKQLFVSDCKKMFYVLLIRFVLLFTIYLAQSVIEIYVNERFALILISIYFIINSTIGDRLNMLGCNKIWYVIVPVNFTSYAKLNKLHFWNVSYILFSVCLTIIFIAWYNRMFSKKDIV